MDIRKVKKLIELLEESDVAEIEIHEGDESVHISRTSSAVPMTIAATSGLCSVATVPESRYSFGCGTIGHVACSSPATAKFGIAVNRHVSVSCLMLTRRFPDAAFCEYWR